MGWKSQRRCFKLAERKISDGKTEVLQEFSTTEGHIRNERNCRTNTLF